MRTAIRPSAVFDWQDTVAGPADYMDGRSPNERARAINKLCLRFDGGLDLWTGQTLTGPEAAQWERARFDVPEEAVVCMCGRQAQSPKEASGWGWVVFDGDLEGLCKRCLATQSVCA